VPPRLIQLRRCTLPAKRGVRVKPDSSSPRQERPHLLPALGRAAHSGNYQTRQLRQARPRMGTAVPESAIRFAQRRRSANTSASCSWPPSKSSITSQRSRCECPRPARIHTSLACADCGEATLETRVRLLHGRHLCPPCREASLAGSSPLPEPRLQPTDVGPHCCACSVAGFLVAHRGDRGGD